MNGRSSTGVYNPNQQLTNINPIMKLDTQTQMNLIEKVGVVDPNDKDMTGQVNQMPGKDPT